MADFTDDPVDLEKSLACKPGGNQLVKKKKKAAYLSTYELLETFVRELLEAKWDYGDLDDFEGHSFEEYYDEPIEQERIEQEKEAGNLYRGRNVVWIGDHGRMVRVSADEVAPIEDNIFDFAKMKAVRDHIENSDDYVYFQAAYGQASIIDIQDIIETNEAYLDGRLDTDYPMLDYPYSLGDDELDLYLVSPKDWHEEHLFSLYPDYQDFLKMSPEQLQELQEDDPDDYQMYIEEKEAHEEKKAELEQAIADKDGNLGEVNFTIRDGNHRAFGALAAGEPFIWVIAHEDMTNPNIELK